MTWRETNAAKPAKGVTLHRRVALADFDDAPDRVNGRSKPCRALPRPRRSPVRPGMTIVRHAPGCPLLLAATRSRWPLKAAGLTADAAIGGARPTCQLLTLVSSRRLGVDDLDITHPRNLGPRRSQHFTCALRRLSYRWRVVAAHADEMVAWPASRRAADQQRGGEHTFHDRSGRS